MHRRIESLLSDQRGLTTVEYVIVLCLIAVLAVGTWQKFGQNVDAYLTHSIEELDSKLK